MATGAVHLSGKGRLLCMFLCFGYFLSSDCGNSQTTLPSSSDNSQQDFNLNVTVQEVRIDAVVLDRRGRQVRDLTANDFEVYQDGKSKQIMSCTYVNEEQAPSKSKAPSSPILPRNNVRRTLAFVVDDLSMDFDHFRNAKMAIEKFVETQMQPNDLAVIFQTSGGMLLQFSSDRDVLLSRVKNLRWKGGTGGMIGCGPSGCGVASATRSNQSIGAPNQEESLDGDIDSALESATGHPMQHRIRDLAKAQANEHYKLKLFESQIAAVRYCIETLRDMPGRKSLLFMSSAITFPEMKTPGAGSQDMDIKSEFQFADADMNFYSHVKRDFDKVADEALRAGVVIQTLDVKGLMMSGPANPLDESYIPFSKKTGGIIVENNNFFMSGNGIGPVEEELKGYYLISFIPPPNAFSDIRDVYHRIKVKVKRSGTEIHTRDGYLGAPPHSNTAPVASANTLEQAIVSPFLYNDLKLDMASGYAYAPTPGYFLRSWLQLDGKDLNFTDEQDGSHSLSLELVSLTFDSDGVVQDSKGLQYKFKVDDKDLSGVRKAGVDFNIYVPVKNSGDYYVRTAIRDRASGKIGSAYQFLQIPDLKKHRMALSSIFVINQNEEATDIKSGNIGGNSNASDSTRKLREAKSPAVRTYLSGEGFDYLAMVYNATTAEGSEPKLESQVTIFKDGKKYFEGNREDIDLHGVADTGRIPIMKRLVFDSKMDEGAYLLQLAVRDKQNKGQARVASQAIDFEIRKER
jgi:VWFA-related protein